MTFRRLSTLFLLLWTVALSCMAQTNAPKTPIPDPSAPVSPLLNTSSNDVPLVGSLSGYVPDDKYRLRSGDRLAFQILEDRDPPRSLTVTENGEIDVPYVGRVNVRDKTPRQVSEELKAMLEQDFYHRATVIIAVDAPNKVLGRVYVLGQVRSPGAIEIIVNENFTLAKAILRSGGFTDFANRKRVKVVRGDPSEGSQKQTLEVNVAEILEDGKTEKDIPLQPDDFVIVSSRTFNF